MTEDLRDPTSKHGWVKLGYDRRVWIPCPPVFPEGFDRDSWAAGFAQEWWDGYGLAHSANDVELLKQLLTEIHKSTFERIPCHLAFIHLPDPRLMPLPVFLGIFESVGQKDERLRLLTHADDRGAVEPPIVDEFSTDLLGTGLRVLRYLHAGDGALYAALNYAWRSEEYDTDVRLWASSEDLGRLERATPDIDEFARTMRVVPKAGLRQV